MTVLLGLWLALAPFSWAVDVSRPVVPALPAAVVHASVVETALPSLPSPAAGLPQTLSAVAPASGPELSPTAAAQLDAAAADLTENGDLSATLLFTHRFDGARAVDDATIPEPAPRVPQGVVAVEVHEVRTKADVLRLIPNDQNSQSLRSKLALAVDRMAPYRIFRYIDSFGGSFTAIDLSQNPGLIENFPEQESHEIVLVKKLQAWTRDIQLVVRERAKTPDLVMDGVMTELKSLIGRSVDVRFLINKANIQVGDHAKRHGLARGAAALDLQQADEIPVEDVLYELNRWAKKTKENYLGKIHVFAGGERITYTLGADGSYHPGPVTARPGAKKGSRSSPASVEAFDVLDLVQQGRVRKAEAAAERIGLAVPADAWVPLTKAKRAVAATRLLGRMARMRQRRQFKEMDQLWDDYRTANPGDADLLVERVEPFLRRP